MDLEWKLHNSTQEGLGLSKKNKEINKICPGNVIKTSPKSSSLCTPGRQCRQCKAHKALTPPKSPKHTNISQCQEGSMCLVATQTRAGAFNHTV